MSRKKAKKIKKGTAIEIRAKYTAPRIARFVDMIYVVGNEWPVGIVLQSSINKDDIRVFSIVENKKLKYA